MKILVIYNIQNSSYELLECKNRHEAELASDAIELAESLYSLDDLTCLIYPDDINSISDMILADIENLYEEPTQVQKIPKRSMYDDGEY